MGKSQEEAFIGGPLCEACPPALLARHLYKRNDSVEPVWGISFEVQEGECFGFLRPNGAG